ncbi:ABC transporter substrate-binding protein [Streptomyces albireticuli]|uniref:ABC transporter substrate-binding protein n=1 Tax=Streptomyces albireticuli TaxID=1940 RepID=A0A2A2D9U5_9ACTN|nr:extracellular solute-binding protein [Streptomyces albireticuli]MCD9142989.1 extracellular solute-binding protein [Streptomyces albireticuli]MCD9165232.1 extracellular solute-binding protein [Streptomyces albireticuli]MCD9192252.1 extracellular solute-binding protein [Streptomyces albireticuli]PAU48149.1 ABC transporter substrate-binding protein [Streptomyces albireticuli]
MQRRRFLGLTAAGAATAALAPALTACGSEASGATTLKLVAADYGDKPGNSSKKYWDALAREFHEKNSKIKVDVEVYSWNEVDKKVAEMVAAGKAPDLAQIGAYADFAAAGKLYSAEQLLTVPTQADLIASIAKAGEVNRVQYGLPFVGSTRLLFCNKTLFAQAGIAKPPESWDELKAAATKLQSVKGVKMPFGLPLGPEEAPAETMLWMLSGGGGYTDHNGSYTIDSSDNVRTFEWLRDEFVGKGLTGSGDPARTNRQDVFDAFCRGEVGMLHGHPTLMQQATAKGVKYMTAPLPGVKGKAKSTMGVADWMMAFKQNGNREQIGLFLDFVYSTKNVLDFTGQYDLLPVTSSASAQMLGDAKHKDLRQFLEQLENATFYPADKTSWAKVSKDLKEKIGSVVKKGGDPASVLSEIKRDADSQEIAAR